MPLAVITHDPNKEGVGKIATSIADILPGIVAKTLSIPGHPHADLGDTDTEIRVQTYGPFDKNIPSIGIQIFANDYPERNKNLEERNKEIATLINESGLIPEEYKGKIYVWTMLFPAAYNTF